MAEGLELGAEVIDRLLEVLGGDAHELADPYAEAVLEAARAAAAAHPTPQSRMAASGLVAERGTILAPAGARVIGSGGRGARLGDIIGGAEFGSSIFEQFAPRRSGGYWLLPAADRPGPRDAADRALEEVLSRVVR